MEYTGLVNKYKINRPLSEDELASALPRVKSDIITSGPADGGSIIHINKTFIEIADKFYPWKGFAFAFMLILTTLSLAMLYDFAFIEPGAALDPELQAVRDKSADNIYKAIGVLMFGTTSVACLWLMLKESFTYTHWPVRLNRKNRTIYIFKKNNVVLKHDWDRVYFCIGRGNGKPGDGLCDIRGHIVNENGLIIETFSLGFFGGRTIIPAYWEYFRRYMEDGPDAIPAPDILLPISDRREGFTIGMKRMWANFNFSPAIWLLTLPLSSVAGVARYICMLTNRIPKWPKEIEDACQIEDNDLFARLDRPIDGWSTSTVFLILVLVLIVCATLIHFLLNS